MSSGFVSTSELEEEKKRRQEEWERVRKPDDPAVAPEPEVCNKSLYEQLRDNKEAKQAEIDEAKKFKNMIRGIDEDESEFLARVNQMKSEQMRKAKKEEEEALREAAIARSQLNLTEPPTVSQLKVAPTDNKPQKSKQAAILSTAIKRKSTSSNGDGTTEKLARPENPNNNRPSEQSNGQPAVSAMKIVGKIPGIGSYDASRFVISPPY
ncbi:unnamed protein product [Cylicostephanus goldi]|uniref:FAM192A/Fyv6 N-terminal domain-containing protein n=1 Tax=Cylicostephanus goldi TaxID=71465 RepID=A0A3P6QYE9_CYLGO|nr:unnamed protein product [Cylicostephanus goldi]